MSTQEIWPSQWWWPVDQPVPNPILGRHRPHAAVVLAVSSTGVIYQMYYGKFELTRAEFLARFRYLRN